MEIEFAYRNHLFIRIKARANERQRTNEKKKVKIENDIPQHNEKDQLKVLERSNVYLFSHRS